MSKNIRKVYKINIYKKQTGPAKRPARDTPLNVLNIHPSTQKTHHSKNRYRKKRKGGKDKSG
jgi:hypothetical protein